MTKTVPDGPEGSTQQANVVAAPRKRRLLEDAVAILATPDIRYEYVPTPELGEDTELRVRALTSRQLAQVREGARKKRPDGSTEVSLTMFNESVCALGIMKENGDPVFGSEHREKLRDKSSGWVQRCADAIIRLSGMGADALREMKDDLTEDPSPASSTT